MASLPPEYSVSEVTPARTTALLTMLPELMTAECLPPRSWIAHLNGRQSALIGAAAFVPSLHDDLAPGFRCLARVLPDHRRRGVGRQLLARLIAEAECWGVSDLQSWQAYGPGEQASFLRALCFAPSLAVYHFRGTVAQSLSMIQAREANMRAHGRIPGSMAVVQLADVPLEAVIEMYYRQVRGSESALRRHITESLQRDDCRALSVAAWDGKRLAGFLLADVHGNTPKADLWLSDPELRSGWVATLTLNGVLQRVASMGKSQFRFHCNERAQATLNFARRTGAVLEATHHNFVLPMRQSE